MHKGTPRFTFKHVMDGTLGTHDRLMAAQACKMGFAQAPYTPGSKTPLGSLSTPKVNLDSLKKKGRVTLWKRN